MMGMGRVSHCRSVWDVMIVVVAQATEVYSRGAQASPTFKPAKLSNGAQIKVCGLFQSE